MNLATRIAVTLSLTFCGLELAQARPIIIEESAVLTPPPGVSYVSTNFAVGTNGEYALMVAAREQSPGSWLAQTFDALLYRRVNGNWAFQRILAQGSRQEEDYSYFPVIIAMKGNLASTILGEAHSSIFRFDGTDWVPAGSGAGMQEDVSIDGGRILYGVPDNWSGRVFEPNGSGGWTSTFLPGQPRCCDDEYWGGPVDLLGDRAILATPYTYDLEPQEVPIYQRQGSSSWSLFTKIQIPPGEYSLGGEVGLHGENALVTAVSGPPFIFNSNYFYSPTGRLEAVNSYARTASIGRFAKSGNYFLVSSFDPDLRTSVVNVFRPDSAGRYQRVAILKPSSGNAINGEIEIDGNTVIAGSSQRALIFQLPATLPDPQPRYENFEGSYAANWTPTAGSSFAVVRPNALNGVYRQSNTRGDAQAVLNNSGGIHQAVEADIRPTAFNCADCWVGLATRYADARNYYYVTLRGSQAVQLKRMRGGVFTALAAAPLTVQLNRNYRVRLESIGNTHRVFVDGRLVLTADDNAPLVAGNAAIVMYRAQADYDNVTASPGARGTIFANDFTTNGENEWTHTGTGQWTFTNGRFAQSSVAGDARAIIGAVTDDQIVSVRVRPIAYASSTTNQERWVGLMARYRDDQNYYYLTLRSGNSLSLRKLVNGVITPIGTVPVNVSLGSWYTLRLEATGNSLRVWLNDALLIQETDSTHASGRAGPVTYKAAADYDDYAAYQP